jgi:hypothetical protein
LLDLARRQVDDAMLAEIARADYGQDTATHLAALGPIRDHGLVPAPMRWHPGEVLELIRWSQPDNAEWKPGGTGKRGHQMRAFACAALLRAAAEPGNECYVSSDDSSLAQCLASAKVLGEEMLEATARFLTWRTPLIPDGGDPVRLVFPLGLLVVAMHLQTGRFEEHVLGQTAEWVLAEEAAFREADGPIAGPEGRCLYGLLFSIQQGMWQSHAADLIRRAAAMRADDVRKMLEFVGGLVLDPY